MGSKVSDIQGKNVFDAISLKALETKQKINRTTSNYKAFVQLNKPSAR